MKGLVGENKKKNNGGVGFWANARLILDFKSSILLPDSQHCCVSKVGRVGGRLVSSELVMNWPPERL